MARSPGSQISWTVPGFQYRNIRLTEKLVTIPFRPIPAKFGDLSVGPGLENPGPEDLVPGDLPGGHRYGILPGERLLEHVVAGPALDGDDTGHLVRPHLCNLERYHAADAMPADKVPVQPKLVRHRQDIPTELLDGTTHRWRPTAAVSTHLDDDQLRRTIQMIQDLHEAERITETSGDQDEGGCVAGANQKREMANLQVDVVAPPAGAQVVIGLTELVVSGHWVSLGG